MLPAVFFTRLWTSACHLFKPYVLMVMREVAYELQIN